MEAMSMHVLAVLTHAVRVDLTRRVALLSLTVMISACGSKPPPDYAPDPGLVARIVELRMYVGDGRVCPGSVITEVLPHVNESILQDVFGVCPVWEHRHDETVYLIIVRGQQAHEVRFLV